MESTTTSAPSDQASRSSWRESGEQQALVAAQEAALVGDALEGGAGSVRPARLLRAGPVRPARLRAGHVGPARLFRARPVGPTRILGRRAGTPACASLPGHERPRPAEEPALPERGAERPRTCEVRLGLDPLGEHDRARALDLGADGVDHPRGRDQVARLHESHVELDHIRRDERHERERALVGADVVDRDATPALAQPAHGGEHLGGARRQRALRQLGDEREAFGLALQRVVEGLASVERERLHVDEQQPVAEIGGHHALDRRGAADTVELHGGLGVGRRVEQRGRRFNSVPAGPRARASQPTTARVSNSTIG